MIPFDGLLPWQLLVIVPAIAFLYASVGFGGASGYLAAMSLFTIAPSVMSTTALVLNILVSSISFASFHREGHFSPRLLWPFLLTSVPAAFLGGLLPVPGQIYFHLLYLSLSFVAFRMLFLPFPSRDEPLRNFAWWHAALAGGAIGLLSGIIGIGGGIFLSPLIILAGWGTSKQAAASAAGFIFINSAAGLLGRVTGGTFEFGTLGWVLLPLGVAGALGGARLGSRHLSSTWLRRVLGVVLVIAVARYWLS